MFSRQIQPPPFSPGSWASTGKARSSETDAPHDLHVGLSITSAHGKADTRP